MTKVPNFSWNGPAQGYPTRRSPLSDSGARTLPGPADALGGFTEVPEDAFHVRMVLAAPIVEADRAVVAVEKRGPDVSFEHTDAVGHGGSCDLKLFGSTHETLMPGGGFEEAEAVEGRQSLHSPGVQAHESGPGQ